MRHTYLSAQPSRRSWLEKTTAFPRILGLKIQVPIGPKKFSYKKFVPYHQITIVKFFFMVGRCVLVGGWWLEPDSSLGRVSMQMWISIFMFVTTISQHIAEFFTQQSSHGVFLSYVCISLDSPEDDMGSNRYSAQAPVTSNIFALVISKCVWYETPA